MPIATSSMLQNQIPRPQLARKLWGDFRMYAGKARQAMISKRNMALQDAPRGRTQQEREQQRSEITKLHERQYYLEMREEWAGVLQSNGLQHEDWGTVSAQEAQSIRQFLGPEELEAEEDNVEIESHNHPPPEFTPAGVAAQPLSRGVSYQSQQSHQTDSSYSSFSSEQNFYAPPSLPSRSENTSSASYAFVDPRQFTNDDRDEYMSSFSSSKGHAAHAVGSEDEDNGGVPVPSYKSWAHPGRQQQQQQQQQPSGPTNNWSSSNPSSLSSSPADPSAPLSRSHHQLSSSLSSSSHFPPHVPSSLSKSISADDDPDRIFAAPNSTATAAKPTFTSTSSAAAAVAVAVDGPAKPKSKIGSRYIGPHFTTNDSENEADADFANMSQADQNAAYERYKLEARILKIQEFHDEAARYDIELARKTHELGNSQSRSNKALIAQLVTQHDQDMLQLRATKEEERTQLVRDERNRMTAEIEKGRTGGGGGGPEHAATATAKKGRGTTIKGPPKNGVSSSTTSSSSAFGVTNKPPTNKHNAAATSSSSTTLNPNPMNIDGLQNIFDHTPDVDLDTAFQMSQFLQSEDGQEWGTPQTRNMPNHHHHHHTPTATSSAAAAAGARQRKDSISILDESRFGTISAGSGNRRRGTITVSTSQNDHHPHFHPPTAPTPNNNGFWRPQAEPSSPEESEAMTDQYAKFILGEAQTGVAVHQHQAEEDDGWFNWGSKPPPAPAQPPSRGPKATGGGKATSASGSAWTSKKPSQTTGKSSPAMMATPNGSNTNAKKPQFGFNGGAHTGEWGWDQGRGQQESGSYEEYEEVEGEEEEEEEEHFRPQLSSAQQRKSSLLSDMMTKGKNAVAGAVGAAIGMGSSTPTMSHTTPAGMTRKLGAQRAAAPTPPPPSAPATNAGKIATKKGRTAANKKTPLTTFDDFEELETQPQLKTPKASAGSTKFTSAFGFGSPPTSARNAAAASSGAGGGMWDDMVSTTPKPVGLSGIFGGNAHQSGAGGVRKPSGLHHRVWNAEEEEEEEEEEEDGQDDAQEEEAESMENEWSMPGALNPRVGFGGNDTAGKFGTSRGAGAGGGVAGARKSAATNTSPWGRGSASKPSANAAPPSTTKSKKGSALNGKRQAAMVEEVPDESDGPWNRSPSNVLAPDSRIIMEPKPNKPPKMYEGIIQFGADAGSPEDIRNGPLPTAKRRGGAAGMGTNQEEEFLNQEWFQKAAQQLRQGTEQGNRIFGEPAGGSGIKPLPTGAGVNIHSRGNNNATNGLKSNNARAGTPSFSSFNTPGSMSESWKDMSPLANGPPPKMAPSLFGNNANASKSSLNQAWGPGVSSSPKIGVGIGKNANVKAKPTTGTTTGFGWGARSSVFGNSASAVAGFDQDDSWGHGQQQEQNEWGEQSDDEEERERREELLRSKQKLQQMFGDSESSNTKPTGGSPAAGVGGGTAKARRLKEQKEREEREREEERERQEQDRQEQEAREREEQEAREREAQEKAAKEKEAKEKEAAATKAASQKPGGAKKGKGKKR